MCPTLYRTKSRAARAGARWTALARENVSQPGGTVRTASSTQDVRTQSRLTSLDDIRNLTIQTTPSVVQVGDLATVTDTTADQTRIERFNGKDAIDFSVTKQSNANSVQVADNVRAQLQQRLPPGSQLNVTNDTSIFTRLRPIVMTSATVLFAMLPPALKLQDGGESWAPLAVVIMGGVINSTLLTLVLVPAVYTILDDARVQLGRLWGGLSRLVPRQRPKLAPAWRLLAVPEVGDVPGHSNGHAQVVPGSLVRVLPGDRPAPSGRRRIRVVAERAHRRLA